MTTKHFVTRAQQRGIPPLIDQWLDEYGEQIFDGHGGVLIAFTKRSIKAMERDFGRRPVSRMSEYLNAYKVESSHDGETITIGRRFRRIKRH